MKATHMVKISILANFPEYYTDEMVKVAIIERFRFLQDQLENVEVEKISGGENSK